MRGLLLLLPLTVFAGQSVVLTPGVTASVADANLPQNQSWRVEFQMHDWVLPPQGTSNAYVFDLEGTGAAGIILPDGRLELIDWRDTASPAQPCYLSLNGRQDVLVRLQRDVANKVVGCEIWNADGTGYQQDSVAIVAVNTWLRTGGTLGSAKTTAALAFLRVYGTTVADGSRPPVTADSGALQNLTFGSGTGSISVVGASYVATPDQNPVAFVKTAGAPAWNNWLSLRAGFPAQLDGSRSYSLADGSSQVSYQWSQVSGPTTVRWSDTTSATPTIEGLIFGTYTFQLTVKDIAGNTASTTLQVGAVATDANGVVVQADPAADKLFGPMIAFGQNPWGYADERALKATTLRSAAYDAQGLTNPTWQTPLAGTVTYNLWPTPTSLAADLSAGAMQIRVNDVTPFDLTTFPTRILVGNAPFEEIRICSATGNVLQVCYDGRGWRAGGSANGYHYGATAWGVGTRVYQAKVPGTGTQFMANFCPAGSGWSGPITYQDGTVTVAPGSTSVTGNGTLWSNTNAGGTAIRINGTHGGGNPFAFQAYVSVVNGATSLTLNRPWPSDADAGSFQYSLIYPDTRNLTPHYTRKDGSDGIIYFYTSGCESDTDLYLYLWWDNGITGVQTDKQYSFMDGMGYNGDFGPNYYDEVLAHYALYYRSGWAPARDAARKLGDNWMDFPEIANGDAGGPPRRMSVTGAMVGAVLDGRTQNWSGLRTFANRGVYTIAEDCNTDLRENAYGLSWLALAALFDPVDTGSSTEPNQRSYWKSKLAAAAARDASCSSADHSFKTGFYFTPGAFPALTVTNGSAVATGTNLPPAMCPASASGTGVATANSAVITGSGFQIGDKIVITGTRFGQLYSGVFEFRTPNPFQANLSVLWPGDTGPITWMVEGNAPGQFGGQAFATLSVDNTSDTRFGTIWACHWDSPSQVTLNRPWVGTGTETVQMTRYNLVGRGTQPFMLGIKTEQMSWGSLIDDQATASSYRDLAAGAASWITNVAYDPLLKAISYGRIFPQCEPPMTESGDPVLGSRIPGCIENSANPDAVSTARARNSEVQNAVRVAYQANPTGDMKALGDQMYCAQWGNAAMTQPGYCTEAITTSNVLDVNLGSYKWTGFFFGVGMAHQWPAARVGGVSPAVPQTVSVALNLGQAAKARVTVTQPSSATTQYMCSSSPCMVQIDARQGAHWAQIDYLSSTGQVLSSAQPVLLAGSGLTVVSGGTTASQPVTLTAANPSFSLAGGTYTSTKSVTISTTTAGASIRYTTDGTIPSSTVGTVYGGPVAVSSTLTLKAIAYANGMTASSVTTATFTITAAVTGTGTGTGSVSVSSGATAWYSGAWTNRKAITIDHTKVSGSENLVNFPMLLSVIDANLKTVANGGNVGKVDGTDILFTASDGVTKLDHELENYSASGQVNAWVRLPVLSPTTDTVIYLYYGNASAADQQSVTGVWDSNFAAVLHLPNGTTLTANDSTNHANGTVVGSTAQAGNIGGAAAFDGTTSKYIDLGAGTSINTALNGNTFTVSAWVNSNSTTKGAIFGNADGNLARTIGINNAWGTGVSVLDAEEAVICSSGSNLSTGVWHYLTWTYNHALGDTHTLYIDGAVACTGRHGFYGGQSFAGHYYLSNKTSINSTVFNGGIDETRVSNSVRSPDWIGTEYRNQSSPATFFSVGGQQSGN